jgi:hypothetical protein
LLFGIMDRAGVTRLRLASFYLCLTAATLGKGPIGLALPASVIVAYAFVSPVDRAPGGRSWRDAISARLDNVRDKVRALAPARGLLAVGLVVGAWYAAAWAIGGNDFLVKHVLKENVLRVLDPDVLDTGHRHGILYLPPHWFLGALPWSLLAPGVAWFLWRSRPLDPTMRYLAVWFVTVIVFFSIPASKRAVYLLPADPAGALLLGLVLGPGPEAPGPRRLVAWGFLAAAVALAVVGLAALVVAAGLPVEGWLATVLRPKDLQGTVAALAALRAERWRTVLGGAILIAGAALAAREAPGAHWLRANLALSAALVCAILFIALPVERSIADSRSLKPFFAEVNRIVAERPVAFYRAFDYGAVYYAGRHIHPWEGDLGDPAAAPPPYLLLWEDEAARHAPHLRVLLASTGTNPKGRTHMVLAVPRSAALPRSGEEAAPPRS